MVANNKPQTMSINMCRLISKGEAMMSIAHIQSAAAVSFREACLCMMRAQ